MEKKYFQLKKQFQKCLDETSSKIAQEDAIIALIDVALNYSLPEIKRLELVAMFNRIYFANKKENLPIT